MLDHYTSAARRSIESATTQTIYSYLPIARAPARTRYRRQENQPGRWQNVHHRRIHERVVSAAKGLIALGIAKGDAVTIFSSTRLEWGILDFALAAVGAVSVPIYDTDSAPQASAS